MANSKRAINVILICGGACFVAAICGLCFGATTISLAELFRIISGQAAATDPAYRILMHVRLPRVLGGLLAGAAFAVSGAIIQAVLDNPLSSPNLIGVNAGAGLFVLIVSALFPMQTALLPLAAFFGALLTCMLILALAAVGGVSRLTLVLIGIAISSVFAAGMNTILILYPDAYVGSSTFLVGGLASVRMKSIAYPAVMIALGLVLSMLLSRNLNIITLGGETASALGMHVSRNRVSLLIIAAALAGAAVSFAGLIGFVGLIAPHAVRFFVGADNRFVLPASALAGAAFVVFCDLAARTMFAPYELPVGIMMSAFGGPFFIWLIIRRRGER